MKINNSILRISLALTCLLFCSISFAGWELLQNSPTTNDLHSVYFLDYKTGWIAGYNNTIFKTTNSGESWIQQTSPEASNFQCITFVNSNTGWACGSGGTVIKTTNGGTSWFSQTFTGVKFNSLDFIDANTGFICGDNGIIWKTINGGGNWVNQPTGIGQNLYEIRFFFNDPTTLIAVGNNACILKTTNGGITWSLKNGPGIANQIFYTINQDLITTGTITKYSNNDGENWNLGGFPTEAVYSLCDWRNLGVGGNGYIAAYSLYYEDWTQIQSPTAQNLYSVHYQGNNYQGNSNFIWAVGANGTIIKFIPDWKYIFTNTAVFYDIDFINQNTGWIAGDLGSISKTTNSGANWFTLSTGINNKLISVNFTDANIGYSVGFVGTIIKTTNSGINWAIQTSGTVNNLYFVYFINANTGYSVGENGTNLKTTNSGANWIAQTSGTASGLWSVYFTDANIGYSVGENGTILKTTNSGANWIAQTSGTASGLWSVYFTDANTGYSVGENGTILKTTNSGANWIAQTSGTAYDLLSVYFIDANLGYVCSNGSIYKTTNGGNNWYIEELSPVYLTSIRAMDFVVENNIAVGFAVGDKILRASFEYLGGEPLGSSGNYPGWVPVNSGTTGFITSVDYINPFVAFGVGGDPGGSEQGLIIRTINGGQTWVRQQSNELTSYFNDVSFADVNNGIAVGGAIAGIIRTTTNGGANWIQQTSIPSYGLNSVDMLDINNAFACGFQGIMLHTSNGGTNWQFQTTGVSGVWWNSVDYINPTTATAVGTFGQIIRTTNTGLNWVSQTSGGNLTLQEVQFIDVNNGIAVSWEGPVLRTTNGGTNWIQADSLGGHCSDVSYIDANNVFIVTYDGIASRIYRSTNGGLNWILQTTDFATYQSVSFTDANNGVITGSEGMVLRTSNAGVISGTNSFYSRNGLNLPINDYQNTNDSINVNITDNLSVPVVTRVYLKIDTVLHTNDADLEFYLEHNGITDTIVYGNGGSGDNFLGTFLNDETNFPLVSGTAPFRGSFKPYRPLARFNGQNPNGYWKLRIYDRASGNTGTLEAWSLNITYTQVIGITNGNQNVPSEYRLYQNYPNPFNPVTKIKFSIPSVGQRHAFDVRLKIYDILGREVAVLINQEMRPGSYLIEWNAANFASGVYFYRLETDNFVETRKMVLIK